MAFKQPDLPNTSSRAQALRIGTESSGFVPEWEQSHPRANYAPVSTGGPRLPNLKPAATDPKPF
jgi:hypothetical protein